MYKCAYIRCLAYQWDPAQAATNLRKHEIDFADATTIFEDDTALTRLDEYSAEQRFVTLGMDALGRLLVERAIYEAH